MEVHLDKTIHDEALKRQEQARESMEEEHETPKPALKMSMFKDQATSSGAEPAQA